VYTLDTNVIIYYLDGNDSAAETLRPIFSSDAPVYLSAMSELELLSLPSLQHEEFVKIGQFIRRLVTVPVDSRIARIASTLRRRYHIKSPDAAIAATAMLTGSTLVTRNIKDFSQLSAVQVQAI